MANNRQALIKALIFVGELPKGITLPQFPQWRHHHRLPEKDYQELFTSSSVLIYFSEYEGFGMPPVEAAINAVCPVYSDIPALREVMVGCGFSFKNNSYEDFSSALNISLNTQYEQIKSWGDKLLKLHNWQDRANKFISALINAK
jgi:glycosyltransferase involved in cell wall biosynthesis